MSFIRVRTGTGNTPSSPSVAKSFTFSNGSTRLLIAAIRDTNQHLDIHEFDPTKPESRGDFVDFVHFGSGGKIFRWLRNSSGNYKLEVLSNTDFSVFDNTPVDVPTLPTVLQEKPTEPTTPPSSSDVWCWIGGVDLRGQRSDPSFTGMSFFSSLPKADGGGEVDPDPMIAIEPDIYFVMQTINSDQGVRFKY